jgi:hypothetical protein
MDIGRLKIVGLLEYDPVAAQSLAGRIRWGRHASIATR